MTAPPKTFSDRILEFKPSRPDVNRAVRATVAFMVPLLLAHFSGLSFDPLYACITAQTIAMVDVRGAYSLRLGLLLSMTVVLSASVALGLAGADSLVMALLGNVLVALCGGLWRHLSSDYGPGLAVGSGLVFFLSLAHHVMPTVPDAHHPVLVTLLGGLFGVLLQISHWPFRPQHPLRLAVSESWQALASLLEAMDPETPDRNAKIIEQESVVRATLNQTLATLHAANHRTRKLHAHMETLNLAAARLAMRVIVFNTTVETFRETKGFKQLEPYFVPVITSLTQTSRALALAVVSRQPSHLTTFEVRSKRLQNLITVLQAQISCQLENVSASAQLIEVLKRIEAQLPIAGDALRATIDRANERSAFSLELFDVQTLTLRPLAATLNFTQRIDPSLVHHTVRMMVLTLIGVGIYKFFQLPHGYWLPFTMIVVLQPDYGSTRQKAAQRVVGTLAGGLAASSVLIFHPPVFVLFSAVAVTIAMFAYFLKRNYGVAVFFITLMIVLLTESAHPITWTFTLERMATTFAGGLLALLAALIFWPVWERNRFAGIMIKALEDNREFLRLVIARLTEGGVYDEPTIASKRGAESSNIEVFSSMRRMVADPKNQQEGLEQAAALANGNQRITRALTVIALHLNEKKTRYPETLDHFAKICDNAFYVVIEFEKNSLPAATLRATLTALESFRLPEIDPEHQDPNLYREPWVFPQLSRIITELSAMLLLAAKNVKEPLSEAQSELVEKV